MKKLFKAFVNVIAVIVAVFACFSMTACKDIKQLDVELKLYNSETSSYEEQTLTIDLYRHLAPKTVDAILENVNNNFYDNTVFYKLADYSSQIMVGNIKADGDNVSIKEGAKIEGEFSSNGVSGTDLLASKGYIGMWRSWTVAGNSYKISDKGMNSATGTWFIPTDTISSYNDYFTIFAKIDLGNEDNADAFEALENVFASSENYENYVVYYTSDMVAHLIKKTDFTPNFDSVTNILKVYNSETQEYDSVNVFKAENSDLVCYNYYTIKLPVMQQGSRSAIITDIKVK